MLSDLISVLYVCLRLCTCVRACSCTQMTDTARGHVSVGLSITLSHYSRVVARFSWALCICSPWPPFCYRQDSCLFCDSGFYSRLLCVFRCVRRDPPTRSVSLKRSADALLLPSSSETPSSKISEETSPLGTVCTDGWCRAALRPDMFFFNVFTASMPSYSPCYIKHNKAIGKTCIFYC